jgi:hypothetical protein
MTFFTQEKGTLLPEKGHLAKLGGGARIGSYAPASIKFTPPVSTLDINKLVHITYTGRGDVVNFGKTHAGCANLLDIVQNYVKPRYHIFGHIHEGLYTIDLIAMQFTHMYIYHLNAWSPLLYSVLLYSIELSQNVAGNAHNSRRGLFKCLVIVPFDLPRRKFNELFMKNS